MAIKLIKRPIPKPAMAVIKREIKIQADLGQGHLNIVSADEVILTRTYLGLIMEYVPGMVRGRDDSLTMRRVAAMDTAWAPLRARGCSGLPTATALDPDASQLWPCRHPTQHM